MDAEDDSNIYQYRNFYFHEECFDKGREKVDMVRQEVIKQAKSSLESQALGEWFNGGYEYMAINSATGKPILKNPKEPQKLKDYEDGIL